MSEPLDLTRIAIDPALALSLPPTLARRRQLLPFCELDGVVYLACAEPEDRAALDAAARHLGRPVEGERADPESLRRAIDQLYGDGTAATRALSRTRTLDLQAASLDLEGEAAIGLVDELITTALLQRASDLHLDPGRDELGVRLRVDGQLERLRGLPMVVHPALVGRIKVLAGLDIAERRAPQDGRFRFTGGGPRPREIDVRTATMPTRHGEKVTMRLLDAQQGRIELTALGLDEPARLAVSRAIARPHGLVLLTGPTGAGKTTTLYAMIQQLLAERSCNVLTVEDPVEYELRGALQVEVTRGDKLGFHRALRHLLRHDPDVVMIGEVRDAESADVAIKSALTGHLVLSTLHTNTALGAVTRLLDLGVERYLVAATLRLAIAQRLVRRLCPHHSVPRPLRAAEAAALGLPAAEGREVRDAAPCRYCGGRGYLGRIGLFEWAELGIEWSDRIARGADEGQLAAHRAALGLGDLRADALTKVLAGHTTPAEAIAAATVW